MALTAPRYIGRDLTVTCVTAKTIWRDFALNFGGAEEDAGASDSVLDETVLTTKIVTGRCTGLIGSVNNGGTLPKRGDVISDLAVAAGSDSLLPSLTAYTNIKVLGCNYDFARGPATFEFNFRSGVLN